MANIEKIAQAAIKKAQSLGASYADCRFVETRSESLGYSDGAPEAVSSTVDAGLGVRVMADGAWGFFGSSQLSEKEAERAARMAIDIARASNLVNKTPVELAPVQAYKDDYKSIFKIDPFTIPLAQKLDYLANLDRLMAQNSQISTRSASLDFRKTESLFVSTIGSSIHQTIIHSGVGIELGIAKSRRERFMRSFPQNGGQYESKGYELLDEFDFASAITRLAEEAIALSSAPDCPAVTANVVLESSVVGLVIHELVGHPLELDRVFGAERNFSGTSFATTDQLDKLHYAAAIVSFISDATHPYGLGSFGYDDEGVKAHKVDLIRDGILTDYLSSRETAVRIRRAPSGAMRADGWGNIPLVRMTNTNLLPGDKTLNELIAAAGDGLYMSTISSWSPSDDRSSFEFGCEIAWEIKGGKLGQVYKNPTFSGRTVEFWNSVAAIGNEGTFRIWGTPNCGKGQPGQNARTGQGACPILVTNLKVGRS
jgi:TldD protein